MRRMTPGRILMYVLLIAYTMIVVYPMLWMLATSLKDSWSIFKNPWAFPEALQWINYSNAWEMGGAGKSTLGDKFLNSIYVDVTALVCILAVSAMAAYAIGRFRFWGSRFLFYLFMAGMALPAFLAVVPLFALMASLKLNNSLVGLTIVYIAYSLSFTIFVLTGFFRTLPSELAEAAAIDGSSPFHTFWRIMLPLAKPGLVTCGIFVFIGLWNEYPLSLVLIQDDARQTLPLGIANLTMAQKYQSDWGALFAALTIAVVPTVILYSLFQRHIQAGLTAGAVKG